MVYGLRQKPHGSQEHEAGHEGRQMLLRGLRFLGLLTFGEDDVGGVWGGDVFGTAIAELGQVDAGEKVFAGAKERRGEGEVHLVDEPG